MSDFNSLNDNPFNDTWLWKSDEKHPDLTLSEYDSLERLRAISNRLIDNDYLCATALQTYISMIVGGGLSVKVQGTNKRAVKEANKLLEPILIDDMDITGTQGIDQITEAMVSGMFCDGDFLVHLPISPNPNKKIKTYVEIIPARRISTPPKFESDPLVSLGVRYDKIGRVLGYYVSKNERKTKWQPLANTDFEYIPRYKQMGNKKIRKVAELVLAPFNLKLGQGRQKPILTSTIDLINHNSKYVEAVVVGARVAACYSGHVTTNNPVKAQKSLSEATTVERGGKQKRLTKLSPGLITYLRPGESITFGAPNRPSDNMDAFLIRIARFFASTLRLSYERFLLDISNVNYSSWRGGSLEEKRNIMRWVRTLRSVQKWILETYLLEGIIKDQVRGSLNQLTVDIKFPNYGSLDEEKRARANKINMLQTKTKSKRQVCAEENIDYEVLKKELAEEQEDNIKLEAEGLRLMKELSEEYDIIFPEQAENRETTKREGELEGDDLDEDDAKDRRKEDGNW